MYTNTKCTLYLNSENYAKTVVDCFMTHRKIANLSKEGMSYPESAFIMLKTDKQFTEGKDYAVEGESNLSLDNTTQQAFSTSMKALMSAHTVYTVMIADSKQFGSQEMRHIELSCK